MYLPSPKYQVHHPIPGRFCSPTTSHQSFDDSTNKWSKNRHPITDFYISQRPREFGQKSVYHSPSYELFKTDLDSDSNCLGEQGNIRYRQVKAAHDRNNLMIDRRSPLHRPSTPRKRNVTPETRTDQSWQNVQHDDANFDANYHEQQFSEGRSDIFRRSLTQSSPFGIHYETYEDSEAEGNSLFEDPVFQLEFKQDYMIGRERRRKLKELAANLKVIDSVPLESLSYNYLNDEELAKIRTLSHSKKQSINSDSHGHKLIDLLNTNGKFTNARSREILSEKYSYHDPTCVISNCSKTSCRHLNSNLPNTLNSVDSRSLSVDSDTNSFSQNSLSDGMSNENSGSQSFACGHLESRGRSGPSKAMSALCLSEVRIPSAARKNLSTSLISLPIEEQTLEQRYITNILKEVFEDQETSSELESLFSERCIDSGSQSSVAGDSKRESDEEDRHSLRSVDTLRSDRTFLGSPVGDNCYVATLSFYDDDSDSMTSDASLVFQVDDETVFSGTAVPKVSSAEIVSEDSNEAETLREQLTSSSSSHEEGSTPKNKTNTNFERLISKESDSTSYFGSDTVNYDSNSTTDRDLGNDHVLGDLDEINQSVPNTVLDENNVRLVSVDEGSCNGDTSEARFSESESCSLPSSIYTSEDEHNRCFDDFEHGYSSSNCEAGSHPKLAMGVNGLHANDESSDEYYEASDAFLERGRSQCSEISFLHPVDYNVYEADRSVGPPFHSSAYSNMDNHLSDDSISYFSDQSDYNCATDDETFENYYSEAFNDEIERLSNISVYYTSSSSESSWMEDSEDCTSDSDDDNHSTDSHLYVKRAVLCSQEWDISQDLPNDAERSTLARSGNSMYFSPSNYSVCRTPTASYNVMKVKQKSQDRPRQSFQNTDQQAFEETFSSGIDRNELNSFVPDVSACQTNSSGQDEGCFSFPVDEQYLRTFRLKEKKNETSEKVFRNDDYLGTFDTRRNTYSDKPAENNASAPNRGSVYENEDRSVEITDFKNTVIVPLNKPDDTERIWANNPVYSEASGQSPNEFDKISSQDLTRSQHNLRNSFYDNYGSDSANSDRSERRRKPKKAKNSLKLKCNSVHKLSKFPTSPDDYVDYECLPLSKYDELCRAINDRDNKNKRHDQLAVLHQRRFHNPKWAPHFFDMRRAQSSTQKRTPSARRRKPLFNECNSQLQELSKYIQKELKPLTANCDEPETSVNIDSHRSGSKDEGVTRPSIKGISVASLSSSNLKSTISDIISKSKTKPLQQSKKPTISQIRTFSPAPQVSSKPSTGGSVSTLRNIVEQHNQVVKREELLTLFDGEAERDQSHVYVTVDGVCCAEGQLNRSVLSPTCRSWSWFINNSSYTKAGVKNIFTLLKTLLFY